jgi:hypothetical protein
MTPAEPHPPASNDKQRNVGRCQQQILFEVEHEIGAAGDDAIEQLERIQPYAKALRIDRDLMRNAVEKRRRDLGKLTGDRGRLDLNEHAPSREIIRAKRDQQVAEQMRPPITGDGDGSHRDRPA